ncbi:hypothetical protein KP509_35G032600 [Ceratopteris richardii]|uniref:Ionotropic glutamate receptor C-terminal domain-containing protein n=1 Tax=Ceratopteris richardii TaxID=49495 RepID=A0A8T2QFR5_CERRI|nr:hypothetical protein KP509_35G032600 [Ceratopteris richardii]
MIKLVANGIYDAVVGDVTIGYNRSTLVDFTQKYMESGIIIIGIAGNPNVSPWTLFIQPFELKLWGTILAVFACTGLLVCYLESDDHPELKEGGTVHRIGNILWFIVEALILLDRDYFRRTASRAAMIAWLFFAVLLGASYTAGLSSFLTFNNLNPSSLNILSLRNTTQKIGYRKGSIVKDIISRRFNFSDDRLVPLRCADDFSDYLKNDSITKILDELPYVNIMFSEKKFLDCQYVVDDELTQQGFGFGFNKNRNLAKNFSKALTELSENGCLKNLTSCYNMDKESQCSSDDSSSNKVPWKSAITIFVPLLFSLGVCVGTKYLKPYFQRKHDDTNMRPVIEDDSSVHLCRPTTPSRYAQEDVYRNEVGIMKLM